MNGITQYHRPIEAEFTDTYAPIPFEEMMQAGMLKQAQEEQMLQRESTFYTGLGNIMLSAADEPEWQLKLQELDEQLADLHKEVPDITSYEAKAELNNIIKTFVNDDWLRAARRNAPLVQTARENFMTAQAENQPYNYAELAGYLQDWTREGTKGLMEKGIGLFTAPGVTEYTDTRSTMEEMVNDVKSSGSVKEFLDPETGDWVYTLGGEGIVAEAIAFPLGIVYKKDEKGNLTGEIDLEATRPDAQFMASGAGRNMINQAVQAAERTAGTPEAISEDEAFKYLYAKLAESVIGERVFGNTEWRMDESQFALLEARKGPTEGPTYIDSISKQLGVDDLEKFKESKTGTAFLGLMELSSPGTVSLFTNIIKAFENKEIDPTEFHNTLDEWVENTHQWATSPEASLLAKPLARVVVNFTKLAFDTVFAGQVPSDPSEEYLDLQERLSFEQEGFAELTSIKKHKAMQDYMEDWEEEGIHLEVTSITGAEKQRRANVLFGGGADEGIIRGDQISGIAAALKVVDPEDPAKLLVLNDLIPKGKKAKRNQTIEYVGYVASDNPIEPGLQRITVGGKAYNIRGSQQQIQEDFLDWNLYGYGRSVTGKGAWFGFTDKPDIEIRSVVDFDESTQDDKRVRLEIRDKNTGKIIDIFKQEGNESIISLYNRTFLKKYKK